MAYKRKPNKTCVACGVLFPPNGSAVTCSDECSADHKKKRDRDYARRHKKRIAEYLKQWRPEHHEEQAKKAHARRQRNLDRYREASRESQRRRRGTDPADYTENRDPEAVKQRARDRWRRGQAARRARLRDQP